MSKISNVSYIEQNTMNNVLNKLMQISFPYIFIVSVIGICGNFLTIILLSKRSLSKNFNNCTLIALALTDLLFNFTLVSRCINDLTQSNRGQLCRLLAFLSHLAELLSACFTAHFTAQRFIAVRFPLSVLIEKKIHLVHYLIVSLFIIFGIIYCLALVEYNGYDDCHEELQLKWFISDALSSFLIPFAIITILNILIIMHLKKGFQNNQQFRFPRRRQSSSFQAKAYENAPLSTSRGSIPSNQKNSDGPLINGRARSMDLLYRPSSVHSKSQSYRVTRMLIVVSTCFLLLNAPSHICTIGFKIYSLKNPISIDNSNEISPQPHENFKQYNQTSIILLTNVDVVANRKKTSNENDLSKNKNKHLKWMNLFYIIIIITQHISYVSYSINFFLYSFCGMKFRGELIRCISNQRRQTKTSRSINIQNI